MIQWDVFSPPKFPPAPKILKSKWLSEQNYAFHKKKKKVLERQKVFWAQKSALKRFQIIYAILPQDVTISFVRNAI